MHFVDWSGLKRRRAVLLSLRCETTTKKKSRQPRIGREEEETALGGNMAAAGCEHYVRSCLLKVS